MTRIDTDFKKEPRAGLSSERHLFPCFHRDSSSSSFSCQSVKVVHTVLLLICSFAHLLICSCDGGDRRIQQAEELLESGMAPEASNLLEKIVATDEQNAKARVLLGTAYNRLERSEEAVAQLKLAANLYNGQPEEQARVWLEIGKIYLRLGNREDAFRELRRILHATSDEAMFQEIAGLIGNAYKVVSLTSGDADNYSPVFSPDGSQIAFSSFRLDNGEIYLMDLNGRIRRRVTTTDDFNDTSPAFLRDPHYILYGSEPKTSREVKVVLQSSGSTPIYAGFNVTHIFSRVTREVLPVGFGVRAPRSSPDGNGVIYESNTDGNLELYLLDLSGVDFATIDANTVEPKRITHNEFDDGSPSFFPGGKRIIFVSSRNEEPHQIYTINIDGTDEKHLNPNSYDNYGPIISPDGKKIVFVSARQGDIEVYMMNVDGTNERRITNGIGVSIQPALSPDGNKLAFVSDRSDNFQIYLMSLDEPLSRQELLQQLQY